MTSRAGYYSEFVDHPRYGRGPRFTDVRPREVPLGHRLTTYISGDAIAGTAVESDLKCQAWSPLPVLYYFDLQRKCIDCGRSFIFFAEEQKYWYETLGFALDADCVRCTDCRRQQHGLDRERRRYEELFHCDVRTIDENFEMAECLLSLIENGVFHSRQTERIRMLLNKAPNERDDTMDRRYNDIRQRMLDIEAVRSGERTDVPGRASESGL